MAAALNILKAWLLLLGSCALLGGLGWVLGGYRLLSIFVFCGLLAGAAVYWYSDRMVLGIVGARPLAQAEAAAFASTVDRLAARAGVPTPRLYLIPDGYPRALSAGRGGRGQTIAVSTGLLAALPPARKAGGSLLRAARHAVEAGRDRVRRAVAGARRDQQDRVRLRREHGPELGGRGRLDAVHALDVDALGNGRRRRRARRP